MTNEPIDMKRKTMLDLPIYRDETIEDLQRDGLRVIQKKDGFRFSEDAIILAHSAHRLWDTNRRGACSFVEFGSHCGIVSILFSALSAGSKGVGLEISARQTELMKRNIRLNGLEDRLAAVQYDVRRILDPCSALPEEILAGTYNFVIANPPYGLVSDINEVQKVDSLVAKEKLIARYEVALSFAEMAKAAYRLLKPRGRFVFVHKPERLPEVFDALKAAHLIPTNMVSIAPFAHVRPNLILIAATKDAKSGGFSIDGHLVVRDAAGQYLGKIREMYGAVPKMSREALYTGLYESDEAIAIDEPDISVN